MGLESTGYGLGGPKRPCSHHLGTPAPKITDRKKRKLHTTNPRGETDRRRQGRTERRQGRVKRVQRTRISPRREEKVEVEVSKKVSRGRIYSFGIFAGGRPAANQRPHTDFVYSSEPVNRLSTFYEVDLYD